MEKKFDFILLLVFFILIIAGLIILTSVSAPFSQENYGNNIYFVKHQILFGFLPGLILFFILLKIELNFLKKYSPIFLFFNLLLTALVFVPPIGVKIRGGARWIKLGFLSFQPSEFLKLTFILYLAAWISSRIDKKEKKITNAFFVFLILIGIISLFLVLQPDISTLGIIFLTALTMFFLSQAPVWQTLIILLIAALLFFPLVKFAPYRLSRILVFLNPEVDPFGIGYQIRQSLIAVGSGKIWGLGLGMSQQKLGVLPQSFSDSVFAVFAEETGFIGSLFLIFLYLFFFWRGFKIGIESNDSFKKLLAFGISFWITLQAFINIGAIIGILPLAGIPLPFISYGGSHLISELGATGILLKISKKR